MAMDQDTLMKELYQALSLSVSPDTEAIIQSTEKISA